MDLSTVFRLGENLNLDKKTLVILRWIAILGQLSAISIVYFFLKLDFPIVITIVIISVGLLSNLFLQFRINSAQLKLLFQFPKKEVCTF